MMRSLQSVFYVGLTIFFVMLIQPIAMAASQTNYLYIQRAREAVLIGVNEKKDTYRLVMTGVDPIVIYLVDGSSQNAGLVPLNTFYKQWFANNLKGVTKEKTRKGLVGSLHHLQGGQDSSLPVQLSEPQFDRFNYTVTYTTNIPRSTKLLSVATKFKNVVLFIGPLND